MCELFGFSSKKKTRCNELLREFFSHGNEHPHGWGMAFFYGNVTLGNSVSVEKQASNALKSSYLKERLRSDIEVTSMLAHIRLATKGGIEYNNTHPFVGRDRTGRAWTLEHNGTIFESEVLKKYVYVQEGTTDSERILLYLIDRINHETDRLGRPLNSTERFQVVEELIETLAPENKLNLLIYDEEYFYAHSNYRKSLNISKTDGMIIISTRPLTRQAAMWEEVPLNTLQVFRDGEIVYKGRQHDHEFIDSEEKMRYLFLDFAQI